MRTNCVACSSILMLLSAAGCATTATRGQIAAASPGGELTTQAPASDSVTVACEKLEGHTSVEELSDGTRVEVEGVLDEKGQMIPHGTTTHRWPGGQKKLEMHFVCGLRHGLKRAWYQNGQPWNQGDYIDGKGHGTWTAWYPDGTKSQEFHLDQGTWQGMQSSWHPNGQKRMEVMWRDGQRQGLLTFWDEEGNVIEQLEFADGEIQPMPDVLAAPRAGAASADDSEAPAVLPTTDG